MLWALVWSTAAHMFVRMWLSASVWYCVSEATCSVSERQGKEEGGGRKVALCTSLCVCFWVFVWRTSQPNRGAGRQAALRQGGRGVKQIKHKPTNHRRWLISAVLKGEPGMSDDSPLWISQWRCAVCHHEYSRSQRRQSREAKVQTETPLALL